MEHSNLNNSNSNINESITTNNANDTGIENFVEQTIEHVVSAQEQAEIDQAKRQWLMTTAGIGCVGALGLGGAMLSSFAPSEKAKGAGAPIEVDISTMKDKEMKVVEWRGKPVWILKRDNEMLSSLKSTENQVADPKSENKPEDTPEYARNAHRSIKPEIFVGIGLCTHLGCSPTSRFETEGGNLPTADWKGGFLCPCHGSTFDLAGRVFKDKPAPDNLPIPKHKYLTATKILIGEDA